MPSVVASLIKEEINMYFNKSKPVSKHLFFKFEIFKGVVSKVLPYSNRI
jgi:hypothetical protein